MATLVSEVSTLQKTSAGLLTFGALSLAERMLRQYAWGPSHGFLNKEAGPPILPPLQHGLCLSVACPWMFFTSHVQVERLELRRCLTYTVQEI